MISFPPLFNSDRSKCWDIAAYEPSETESGIAETVERASRDRRGRLHLAADVRVRQFENVNTGAREAAIRTICVTLRALADEVGQDDAMLNERGALAALDSLAEHPEEAARSPYGEAVKYAAARWAEHFDGGYSR